MLSEKDALSFVELMGEQDRAPADVEAEAADGLWALADRALRGGMDGGTFVQLAEVKFRTALAQYRYEKASASGADPSR
jgi:hypothetical protein